MNKLRPNQVEQPGAQQPFFGDGIDKTIAVRVRVEVLCGCLRIERRC